jgi:hypothetical protein
LRPFLFGAASKGETMKKPLQTSQEGRKCMFPDCECILSIYNSEKYCHKHLDQMTNAKKLKDFINPAAAVK